MEARKIQTYTVDEFYADKSLPECCELINGVIFRNQAAPNTVHQRLSVAVSSLTYMYIQRNKGNCEVFAAPADVKLSDDTVVQPDIYVTCHPEKLDGQKHNGAPDLAIEIVSPGNSGMDYFTKLNLYHEAGVREYWIVNPMKSSVTVYIKDEDKDEATTYTFDENIPVWIFDKNPEKLSFKISELL